MLSIDLSGMRAFVAGVADDSGFGFAIAKALAQAGAKICVGTWPPALGVFRTLLERGKLELSLPDGSQLDFEHIYPLDAAFDTMDDVPENVRQSKRYRDLGDVSISGVAGAIRAELGEESLDIVVHSIANAPEVQKPIIETSRAGYLDAISVSAYSFASMVRHLGPVMRRGSSFLALSYIAGERVIPGYGGGMSSAKAALENDARVLAYEAGRKWGHRVNVISCGPMASRAASAIGFVDAMIAYAKMSSPLPEATSADEVAWTAAFLASRLASGITGSTIYVDKGYHSMGKGAP